jgi:hypothetical protein
MKSSNAPAPATRFFAPRLDWLTLATYKFEKYTLLASKTHAAFLTGWRPGRWLQYDGQTNKLGLFHGHAVQSHGEEHYIVKVSGGNAADFYRVMMADEETRELLEAFYATRIDVQVTAPIPPWWDVRELHDMFLQNGRKVSTIQSDTGSTLYLGARTSGRFLRFYEKELETTYLRLEFELKGDYARDAWFAMARAQADPAQIYYAHLERSRFPDYINEHFGMQPVQFELAKHIREVDAFHRLKWLYSLLNTFEAMANDHDIGEHVQTIFYALAVGRHPLDIDTEKDDN